MDMQTVLEKHDLSLATVLDPDSLKKLASAYEELLDTLTADSETQQNREKQIRDEIKEMPGLKVKTHNVTTGMLDTLSKVMDEDPDMSVHLVDMLQDLKTMVITFRDFHVSSIARNSKPDKVKDSDEMRERKDEAEALRETIVSVFGLLGKPTGIIKTKTNKAGEITVDLPRIPGGNTTGNVGRGAVIRQMRFILDGEYLPEDTVLYDMLHTQVNNIAAGQVIKVVDFKSLVEKTGSEFAPKGIDNKWTVTVFDHEISGWVPTDND